MGGVRRWESGLCDIEKRFWGVKWLVEGDIKGFLEKMNDEIVIGIVKEGMGEERFIGLIRKFVNGGYMEEWKFDKW